MSFVEIFEWSDWRNSFSKDDCINTKIQLFGLHNIKSILWFIYATLILSTGFMYGRHKGIDPYKILDDIVNYNGMKEKSIKLFSACWFIASTFIFPWYLCSIWLYYCIHFNDIHYMNTYNPWILPIIVLYMLYSITVISSYATHCGPHNRSSSIAVRVTLILYGFLALFIVYILMKNKNNNLSDFSFIGFYGNDVLHCVNFTSPKNPILLSIFVILYVYAAHHIFVFLRAFAAKFCGGEYLSQAHKNRRMKRRIKIRKKQAQNNVQLQIDNQNNGSENEGNGDEEDMDEYMSDDMDEYENENDTDIDSDDDHFSEYYRKNRSASRQNGNMQKPQYINEPSADADTPEPNGINIANISVDTPKAYQCV